MAMRRAVLRFMEAQRRTNVRCLSDGKGRVLGEEERAAENIYIQKMERERLDKPRQNAEKEKAGKEKPDKGERWKRVEKMKAEKDKAHKKLEEEAEKS